MEKDKIKQLMTLKELLDSGVLTEEEFNLEKSNILNDQDDSNIIPPNMELNTEEIQDDISAVPVETSDDASVPINDSNSTSCYNDEVEPEDAEESWIDKYRSLLYGGGVIIALVLCFYLFSYYKDATRPLPTGTWYGTVVRCDGVELSPMAVYFSGDEVEVYCNVLTGSQIKYKIDREDKEIEGREVYKYVISGTKQNQFADECIVFELKDGILYSVAENNYKKIVFEENQTAADAFKETDFKNCAVASNVCQYIYGEFGGMMKRERDGMALSPIKIYGYGDHVEVYSNALFGKENISSTLSGFDTDGCIFDAHDFSWTAISCSEEATNIKINGFSAILSKENNYDEKDFFLNKTAWKNPEFYLSGNVYKGTPHFDPSKQTASFIGDAIANTIVTITIINDHQLEFKKEVQQSYESIAMALLTAFANSEPDAKVYEYVINDEGYIHLLRDKNNDQDMLIGENGTSLEMDSPNTGIQCTLKRIK